MKHVVFLIVCALVYPGTRAQAQEQDPRASAVARQWKEFLDLVNYCPYNYDYTSWGSSAYWRDTRTGEGVEAPLYFKDSISYAELYRLMDSIARTSVHVNKSVAQGVAANYVSDISRQPAPEPWQKELAIKYVLMDLEHCARFMDWAIVGRLSPSLFTPEIVQRVHDLYGQSPVRTRPEAEVWAQELYREQLHGDQEYKDEEIEERIIQTLADEAEGTRLKRLYKDLLYALVDNNVQAMAPLIENFGSTAYARYLAERGEEWPDTGLFLARLRYKDYHDEHLARYTRKIDSLRKVLATVKDTIDFHANDSAGTREYDRLREIFHDLKYMNTREACFAMAPLLLLKNQMEMNEFISNDSIKVHYPMNVKFYCFIQRVITNMPIPDIDPDEDWPVLYDRGHKEAIDKMLPVAYKWMMDNKENYEIGERKGWYPTVN
ncbi:MAG: hypothetical protein LBP56_09005 [Odoribacteraceae bacterium]|jgi:hypothetical protein|nr:hypothetical protein [Odoribacteraceae bacterium]